MVLVLEEGEGTTTTTTPAWSRTVTRGPGCRTTPMLPPLAPDCLVIIMEPRPEVPVLSLVERLLPLIPEEAEQLLPLILPAKEEAGQLLPTTGSSLSLD